MLILYCGAHRGGGLRRGWRSPRQFLSGYQYCRVREYKLIYIYLAEIQRNPRTHDYTSRACAHTRVPSDTQVTSSDVTPAVPATWRLTKHLSVDETCAVLQKIGLGQYVTLFRKYNVTAAQLLNCTEKEFSGMFGKEDIHEFQSRPMWYKLQSYLDYSWCRTITWLRRVRHGLYFGCVLEHSNWKWFRVVISELVSHN